MTDGKKVRNMNKLILFRQFYVMVVAYIYFTRIIVFLLKSTAAYNLTWLADFASEVATLAFYLTTGYMFRPVVDSLYLHLNEDELTWRRSRCAWRRAGACDDFGSLIDRRNPRIRPGLRGYSNGIVFL